MSDIKKIKGKSKRYSQAAQGVDLTKVYLLREGLNALLNIGTAKFDESVDVSINLGVDAKQSDQNVRGAVVLPHGTGKTARIGVVAKGDKAKEAEAAGADVVGAEDLIEKIQNGQIDFDKLIATPDMMVAISKVGKILGPTGLMPNPKLGTVTFDIAKAVQEQKKGKVEYRTDKAGIIHVKIGKRSFGADKLKDNFAAVLSAIVKSKPPTSKGTFLRGIHMSLTMSPAVKVDVADASSLAQ